ncbi:polysaccharide deacetylase family protein [Paraburkholderia haematera]|nr:polysaccharide deacetylase family protein [Paraburkholderia haematera]
MPEKSILLTFDDGYLDNYVHAHPCLARYGLNAIMFLVTGRVHDGPARSFLSRAASAERSHAECERLVQIGQADDVTVRWSEIDVMRAAGTFEFHSHTHSHRRWGQLCTDPDSKIHRIRTDIETSKRILTEKMGGHQSICAGQKAITTMTISMLPEWLGSSTSTQRATLNATFRVATRARFIAWRITARMESG